MGLWVLAALTVKRIGFAVTPVVAAGLVIRPSDFVYSMLIAVIVTLIVSTAFVNSFVNFESRFVQYFSHLTSSPRWFTLWLLLMVLWIPTRHLLIEKGYLTSDTDFVVATILWSCVPYMVENLLKSTSAKQMQVLLDKADEQRERDEAHFALMKRVLAAIEQGPEEVSDA